MTCALEFLSEPIEHELAFVHAWNEEAMRRYVDRGEDYAGKNAAERLSKSMPNTRSKR